MSKCLGCGISLQTTNPESLGYTKNPETQICERCFRLKHYGEYQNVSLNNKDYQSIIANIPSTSLVIYVADFLTLDLANIPSFNNLLLVLTKRDILPKSIKDEKIITKIKTMYPNFLDVISISSLKNYHLDELYQLLIKHSHQKDIYFIGNTNSGKSTLINKLIQNYDTSDKKANITVSMYPSTTLDKIKIQLGALTIIDTPGLIEKGNYTSILSPKELKQITPKKEMKPRSCQIAGEGSVLIGTYARIDYQTPEPNSFVIYAAPTVKSTFISTQNNILKEGTKHHYKLEEQKDIVLPGLGFIKFTKPINITIYTPNHIDTYTRDNLI